MTAKPKTISVLPDATAEIPAADSGTASPHRGSVVDSWVVVSSGPDGERLRSGVDAGGPVEELLVLTMSRDADRLRELESRLRLIKLMGHCGVRRIAESDLSGDPVTVRFEPLAANARLLTVAETEFPDPQSRLRLAAELADLCQSAHRLGLHHGGFASTQTQLLFDDAAPRWCLDYTGVRCSAEPDAGEQDAADQERELPALEQDLAGLRRTMADLLSPIFDNEANADPSSAKSTPLQGRTRGVIKSLIQAKSSGDIDALPTPAEWLEALSDWLPESEQQVRPDTDRSSTSVTQPPESPTPLEADMDATGEVQPVDLDQTSDSVIDQVVTRHASELGPGAMLGRFQILDRIGEGGMGTVYRGADVANGELVAIKVLRTDRGDLAQSVRRFRKEARLLADVQNDYVTRLIEVGEDGGHHYLAMEFIDGIDLKAWLANRDPLDERQALRVVGDIARALVDAHAAEVVHRDIKPENVLLRRRETAEPDGSLAPAGLDGYQVKLSDFGIARHIHQSASMEVTQAGALLGTPRYMSPEQCKASSDIGPAADVYALGITLFELLAGQTPFQADDAMKLVAMHCFDPAPSIQKRNSRVSDATTRLIDRMLSKKVEDRFGDASQLLGEIESILHGTASETEAHPKLPEHRADRIWDKTVSWDLQSRPSDLWPFVSNTERLNHAIGLPPVEYETIKDPQRGLRKFGSFRLGGVAIRWEEHPFEWIEGSRMGILREFESGPFKWFLSVVTLESLPGGGCQLSHRVRIEPRNLMGRVLTKVEADWKGFRNLDRVYRRIDRSIQGKLSSAEGSDAFEKTPSSTRDQNTRLAQRIEDMIEGGVDPSLAESLADLVRQAAPQELAQLRPLALADRLGVDGQDAIDACLIAASCGLLEIRWDVLCPSCRTAAFTSARLDAVDAHTHCEACDADFKSNLGDAIELVFRVHPEIRQVDNGQYCIGGPEHSPHVVAQLRLDAGERLAIELDLPVGEYLLRGQRLASTQDLAVRTGGAPSSCELKLSEFGSRAHVPHLRFGRQKLTLTNDLSTLHVVRVERTIPRDDVVTATAAQTMATFRRLFPEQTFASENPVATEQLTLLTTQVNNVDDLYQILGDTEAYEVLDAHLRSLTGVVERSGGAVVKTVDDGMLAVFERAVDAARSAIRIRQELSDVHPRLAETGETLQVGIGVHAGPVLVTTRNRHVDYFGATVRAATTLPAHAGVDSLLTERVYRDPDVRQLLNPDDSGEQGDRARRMETVSLPGVPRQRVHRLIQGEEIE